MITGLYTLSSKLPCDPPNPTAAVAPCTCTHTIVIASHCVGFTLPGMIDDPGSFSGITSSPSRLGGMLAQYRRWEGRRNQPARTGPDDGVRRIEERRAVARVHRRASRGDYAGSPASAVVAGRVPDHRCVRDDAALQHTRLGRHNQLVLPPALRRRDRKSTRL